MATFKLNPAPTFGATVHLTVPGQAETAALSLTFRHQGRKALDVWMRRPGQVVEGAPPLNDADFLGEVIAGWSGVQDADGAEIPFSAEAFGALLDAYQAAGTEIFAAYVKALTESRAKN